MLKHPIQIMNESSKPVIGLLTLVFLVTLASQFLSPHMTLATLAYLLLLTGFLLRKRNRKLHITFMLSGIFLDLALVLILQAQRGAVQTAISLTLNPLQQLHVTVSTLAVICYFPILYLGSKLAFYPTRATPKTKRMHLKLGILTFIFRTLGFLLMFSMIGYHH